MSNNIFIKDLNEYKMDIAPVQQYLEQAAIYISKKTGKSIEESTTIAKQMLKNKKIKNPIVTFNHRQDNGDVFVDSTTLTNYIEDNINNNYLVVPSFTAYEDKNKDKSLHATFLEKNIKLRSVNKKQAFAYKQEGNKVLAERYNTLQKSMKIKNNSLSGAYASISTILYNPSAHYSLTSTTRTATSIANALTESIVAGNKHYRNPDLVFNYITAVLKIVDINNIQYLVDKYNIHLPTTMQVMDSILRSTRLYWNNPIAEEKLFKYIERLTPLERASVLYTNDLYHLRQYNDSLVKDMIMSLSMKCKDLTTEPLEVLNHSEEFVLNLVHHICMSEIKGMKVNYKEMVGTEKLNILGSTALNVNLTLEKYKDMLQILFRNDVMPISISRLRDMTRVCTVLSDTDSTVAEYGSFVELILGRNEISDIATAISCAVMTINSQALEHKLRQYSANMNVPVELRNIISYKGEFFWTIFCNTPVAKHYHASTSIQEGNVFAENDAEIKGVQMINSNAPMFIQKTTKDVIKDIHETVNNNNKLDLGKYLKIGADMERELISKLKLGDIEILKTAKVKEAAGYKLGPDKSPYIHYIFWEEVLEHKYGQIDKPPYTAVKIPSTLDSKKKMNEFVDGMTDKHTAERMRIFLTKYNKDNIGTFLLPLIYLGENGIPEELIPAIDINRVVFDAMGAYYMLLSTIGYSVKPDMKLVDLGY